MVHTEIQVKNGVKYFYRTLTVRDGTKFRKIRKYLGKELDKTDLKEKIAEADLLIQAEAKKSKKFKIGEKRLYKQSGAGYALTIGLPMQSIGYPIELEQGLTILYPGDMTYATPDYQFIHYFAAEDVKPTVEEMFRRMDEEPDWVGKQMKRFKKAVLNFESCGERLLATGKVFSEKTKDKTVKLYEEFLALNYNYWIPSIFIDMFDPHEKEIKKFVFRDKVRKISKEDMQVLFLPDESIYWQEKDDFRKLKNIVKEKGLKKTSKEIWKLLKQHSEKYWWIRNDYQTVNKLTASDFLPKLDESLEEPFWKDLPEKKSALFKKYDLDKKTLKRLVQFTKMAYFRDIRKQHTQIANYYIITFFADIAKKFNIPVEWTYFVVPFCDYKKFIERDAVFLKELELRTKKGVWMLGANLDWKTRVESKKAKHLFELVEKHLTSESIVYGSPASLGKVTGKAKIILRQSDFDKFKPGDIIITGMTRPEFVPLMKIASAIITDEGGITCHAAIISRELSKPCVIATQTATKTYKDNDLLEVNANHGIVKLLKRNS